MTCLLYSSRIGQGGQLAYSMLLLQLELPL